MPRYHFALSDHVALERMLISKPDRVLRAFREAQISCLMEVACFARLTDSDPWKAAQIALVAAEYGIPIRRLR